MTAIVNIQTNLAGFVIIENIFMRLINNNRKQIPNDAAAFEKFFSVGNIENILYNDVYGYVVYWTYCF
jgi:hypothetical protein